MKKLLLPFLILTSMCGFSQNRLDSLYNSYENVKMHDTIRWISGLTWVYFQRDESDSNKVEKILTKINDETQKYFDPIFNFRTQWTIYSWNKRRTGKINETEALTMLKRAKELNYPKYNLELHDGLAHYYEKNNAYSKSVHHHVSALKIHESKNNTKRIAVKLRSLSFLYSQMTLNAESIVYLKKALDLFIQLGNERAAMDARAELGRMLLATKDFEGAVNQAKEIKLILDKEESKNTRLRYNTLCYNIYIETGEFEKALEISLGDLANSKSQKGNDPDISYRQYLVSRIYYLLENYEKSIFHAKAGLEIAEKIDHKLFQFYNSEYLYQSYGKTADFENAYKYLLICKSFEGNIYSPSESAVIQSTIANYEQEKRDYTDSVLVAKKNEILDLENSQRLTEEQHKTNISIAGGIAFLVIALTLLLAYNKKRKDHNTIVQTNNELISKNEQIEHQNLAIKEQKEIVEEAHKEITDSINYAKRIQSAILPSSKIVKEHLQESLILYKPKDVVAGDFYWMEPTEKGVLFAAADCTGHGVPGAMVSVICNNGLNRSVREYGLTDPGQILDKTREIVIQEFEKSEEEVKDGMDIALCSLEGTTLKYAGANNPLWIIRSGEILETKANKQPIGKYIAPKPFTTHIIELEKGDVIYIFSDGYVDQFGGEKGKKYKPANLRKLLLSIQDNSMEQQKVILDEAFETWRGNLEQIDDVCVIGVRV